MTGAATGFLFLGEVVLAITFAHATLLLFAAMLNERIPTDPAFGKSVVVDTGPADAWHGHCVKR